MTGKGDKRRPSMIDSEMEQENWTLAHGTEREKGEILSSRCPKDWLVRIPCKDCNCVPNRGTKP